MPVQFILGRAGSGKTKHLLDEIAKLIEIDPLGPPIYWLLPKQATFQAERLLTSMLGAFSRVRVVSFDQLGKEILIHCGDVNIPEVTAIGRRMIIGHLLRLHQKQLKFYTASAHRPGLAAELDSTFGEFERAGLDTPALDDLLRTMEGTDAGLRDKLSDLHVLLNAYNAYIGQDKLDPQRRLALILKRVADCSPLRSAHLFVDEFYDFTAHERRFLTAMAGVVQSTRIALVIDPTSSAVPDPTAPLAELSLFHRTERTYHTLLASLKDQAIAIDSPILLSKNHRFASPQLFAIERSEITTGDVTAIEAFETADARSEVDAVARRIRAAITDGLRYRDIGVLMRDLPSYQEMIAASFAEHGLPYFADHRRTAAHHPLLQMVRACLQIARHNWPHDAVMSLVKTGLAGLNDDQADELENYVLQHRIRGRMWESHEPWKFKRELIIEEDGVPVLTQTDRVDAHRRTLLQTLSPLLELGKKTWPIREISTRLFSVLESFDVRSTLTKWMAEAEAADDLETRGEHEQVWSEFAQLFDHLVELLGDQSITLSDFINVLDSGLDSFDLALTPVKVDQILVGQIDRTRTPELKMVFMLGINEGVFPRSEHERCVISDRDRHLLRKKNIDLDPDSQRRLLDERFLAYLAFTRASHGLIISRPMANDKGRPTNPSGFWLEMLRLLPGLSVQQISRGKQIIGTSRQLITSLMRWVRSGANDDVMANLYQWLISANDLNPIRDRAWRALRYDNHAELETTLARQLFPSPLHAKVKQLETLAECPFRHFAKYGLKLQQRDKPEVTAIDLSNAYHDILENLVAEILQSNQDWCGMNPTDAKEMIRLHAAEIGRRLRGELMLSNARNRYLLDRIERNLEQAVATMCEVSRRGKYRPAYAALRFGKGGNLPAYQLTTPAGEEVHLHGQIDRVDINDKKTGFVVADYKLSAGALSLDRVYHGLSLQLLTYLLVIQANGEDLVGRELTPAAAFLLQLLRSPQTVDHPSEAMAQDDPDYHLKVKPRGLIETRAVKSLDQNLVEGGSAVIGAYIKKDGTLGNRHVSDVADQADFEALLLHVEQRLGELADQVISGDVTVAPYMIARQTPCSHCEYRSVCRFEPGINRYRMLTAMKREEVLKVVSGRVD